MSSLHAGTALEILPLGILAQETRSLSLMVEGLRILMARLVGIQILPTTWWWSRGSTFITRHHSGIIVATC